MDTGDQRYYIHLRRAWYGDATLREVPYLDEVNFGLRRRAEAGTLGEMAVRWFQLDRVIAPRLEVFDDAWQVLSTFSDVLAQPGQVRIGAHRSLTPEGFCAVLQNCGFADLTPLEPGHAQRRKRERAHPDGMPWRQAGLGVTEEHDPSRGGYQRCGREL
ncbi:hypothetical protein [Burkholderia sp. WAC0059]|uniref:hypothetical protein n=1 Tax=Burkholderia sp. WAC0059 TaxID=2066022 RepID=UPI0011AEF2FE|nr:hypothetical protein [Burkholderia sp. WAC0059]